MSTHTAAADTGPEKSVLFCPACGHESPATGDWVHRERRDRTVVECPECGTEIATRGRSPAVAQH